MLTVKKYSWTTLTLFENIVLHMSSDLQLRLLYLYSYVGTYVSNRFGTHLSRKSQVHNCSGAYVSHMCPNRLLLQKTYRDICVSLGLTVKFETKKKISSILKAAC